MTRNYEFEKELEQMWKGDRIELPVSLKALHKQLMGTLNSKIDDDHKECLEIQEGFARYRFQVGDDIADVSLISNGAGVSLIFASPTECDRSSPNGDALHEFISAAVFWALHEVNAKTIEPRVGDRQKDKGLGGMGGIEINAQTVNIGGDVVGRDKTSSDVPSMPQEPSAK